MITEETTEAAAVRATFDQMYAAWAANDADAFVRPYTEDATVVMRGVIRSGRAAVREHMGAGFAGPLKGSRAVDEPQSIRFVGGDTAIVVSRGGIVMAGESSVPAEREILATWVLSKEDGQWRIVAYTNTPAR